MNIDSYYWVFSSSAQSISAFLAFLLTGYAIILSIMSTLEEKDESLLDLLHELKVNHFKKIKRVAWLTAAAIIFSLFSVFLNGTYWQYVIPFYIFTSALNLCAIIWGVWLMISIINPSKYEKLAKKRYLEEKKKYLRQAVVHRLKE
jgi:hypothetical protein